MDKNNSPKLPLMRFLDWCKQKPDQVFLNRPIDRQWHSFTFTEVAQLAQNIAYNLSEQGYKRGDRIAILSKNCAHWIITDLALQIGGFISVPLYVDQSSENLQFIMKDSDCQAIFVGKLDEHLWHRYDQALPASIKKIFFPFLGNAGDVKKSATDKQDLSWEAITQPVSGHNAKDHHATVIAPNIDDIWTILYTSGTSGVPKGVVHTYKGVSSCKHAMQQSLEFSENDRFLSYLPLAHAVERFLLEVNAFTFGIPIAFSESLSSFKEDMQIVKPTLFFSVPRIWKKLQLGVLEQMSESKMRLLLSIPIVSSLVKNKIKKTLGLDKTRLVLSGAAPISTATLEWFAALDINIFEGYALTENMAYGTVNTRQANRIGSVGKPLPNSGLKLSSEGEILFKSDLVMHSYYNNATLTEEAFDQNGYFKTGDLGSIDADGFVYIKGRTKEIFKTAKGEYVAPISIENKLMAEHHCEQVCVMGTGMEQPVAIITTPTLSNDKQGQDVLEALRIKVNKTLLNHEKLSKIIVYPESWTPENGMMTPTLKVKRTVLENAISTDFSQQISAKASVIFLTEKDA